MINTSLINTLKKNTHLKAGGMPPWLQVFFFFSEDRFYWCGLRRDLVAVNRSCERHDNHDVDDEQDKAPEAQAQSHVVQGPGCSAVSLCCLLVPIVVGFPGLKGSGGGGRRLIRKHAKETTAEPPLLFTDVFLNNGREAEWHTDVQWSPTLRKDYKKKNNNNVPHCLLLVNCRMHWEFKNLEFMFARRIWEDGKSPAKSRHQIVFTCAILSLFPSVCLCVCAGECFVRRPGMLEYIWSSSALAVWHTLGHGFVLCCENCDCSLTADAQHNSPERFSD